MLNLRISSPTNLTAAVLATLSSDPAVSELASIPGASLRPQGDLILASVAREAANDLIDRLRELGVQHEGSIQIAPAGAWMSSRALSAQQLAPGSGADSVVWADVTQQAYEDSEPNWTFLSLISLATLIAGIAIILDSQILVIGAMVIGPEFGAIAALGVALVRRRHGLLGQALRALALGFAVGIAVTTLAALAARGLGWVSVADVTAIRPATGFIYTPDRWSFIVALIAAAAGVLALTSARVGGLSGVFISVTTIPAAANIALGIAFGVPEEIWGSVQQLLLNVAGMAIAGWATLLLQQVVWGRVSTGRSRLATRLRTRARGRRASSSTPGASGP
ncbi:DUF389 domain-containing protein [Nocardioides sp. cx-173]|uniref:DUF389 domain-containing protein n=1 Tax=Nocardioides sp. cx-173 TaxID=2898796 RepID=UPI001E355805|nr:DUF389 domain-containing protein [Nocardioides sp. cx-173]MCD4526653.1 DUF389 domain-containing protein [Nocardioides sp. cx-173]UGB44076.1 DUF389 domain-containing protein [Nocardioides sp. cx-173]